MKVRICALLVALLLMLAGCVQPRNPAATEDELFEGRVSAEADLQAYEEEEGEYEYYEEEDETESSSALAFKSDSARLWAELAGAQAALDQPEEAKDEWGLPPEEEDGDWDSFPEEEDLAEVAEYSAYACPMHPDVTSDEDGKDCRICDMKLVLQQTKPSIAPKAEPIVEVSPYVPPMGLRVNDGVNNYDQLWLEAFFIAAGEDVYVDGFGQVSQSGEKQYASTPVDLLLLRLKKGLRVRTLGYVFTNQGKREESFLAADRNGQSFYAVNLDQIKDLRKSPQAKVSYYIVAETDNEVDARKYLGRGGIIRIMATTFQPAEAINDAGEVISRVWTTRFETLSDVVGVVRPEETSDKEVYYNLALVRDSASEEAEVEPVNPEEGVEVEPLEPEEGSE